MAEPTRKSGQAKKAERAVDPSKLGKEMRASADENPAEAELRRGRTSSFAEAMADKSASSVEPLSSISNPSVRSNGVVEYWNSGVPIAPQLQSRGAGTRRSIRVAARQPSRQKAAMARKPKARRLYPVIETNNYGS